MKLNLLFNQDTILADYINIDPFLGFGPEDRSTDKINGDIFDLDWIAEPAQCEEIRAYDIIDFIDMSIKPTVLQNWFGRLAKGGTITIGGNDLMLITRDTYQRNIDFNTASYLLYGNPESLGSLRTGLLTIGIAEKLFAENNLSIVSKNYDGKYRYLITGKRQ